MLGHVVLPHSNSKIFPVNQSTVSSVTFLIFVLSSNKAIYVRTTDYLRLFYKQRIMRQHTLSKTNTICLKSWVILSIIADFLKNLVLHEPCHQSCSAWLHETGLWEMLEVICLYSVFRGPQLCKCSATVFMLNAWCAHDTNSTLVHQNRQLNKRSNKCWGMNLTHQGEQRQS